MDTWKLYTKYSLIYRWLKDLMNKSVEKYPEYNQMDEMETESQQLLNWQEDIGMWRVWWNDIHR